MNTPPHSVVVAKYSLEFRLQAVRDDQVPMREIRLKAELQLAPSAVEGSLTLEFRLEAVRLDTVSMRKIRLKAELQQVPRRRARDSCPRPSARP